MEWIDGIRNKTTFINPDIQLIDYFFPPPNPIKVINKPTVRAIASTMF